MDKVLYKKVCLGIVLLLLSGEFTAQTLKYVDAQKLLMVGKAQPNTEYLSDSRRIARLLQLTGKLNRTSPHKTYRTLPIAD